MQQYFEQAWQEEIRMRREPSQHIQLGVHRQPRYPSTYEQAADEKRKAEQARAKEFFYNFLTKANNAQTEVFKTVMENPITQTIEALLKIPFIPQMIKEEKEKEKERFAKMSDREFCREYTKNNQEEFIECLKDLHKKKQNQSIGPTQ
jgi:hypothetical protein